MKYDLDQWEVVCRVDTYQAPELKKIRLAGIPANHPRGNGKRVYTSSIKSISGREVTTQSGNIYVLGEPSPNYLNWLKSQNYQFDPENPIKSLDFDLK